MNHLSISWWIFLEHNTIILSGGAVPRVDDLLKTPEGCLGENTTNTLSQLTDLFKKLVQYCLLGTLV